MIGTSRTAIASLMRRFSLTASLRALVRGDTLPRPRAYFLTLYLTAMTYFPSMIYSSAMTASQPTTPNQPRLISFTVAPWDQEYRLDRDELLPRETHSPTYQDHIDHECFANRLAHSGLGQGARENDQA